jgi:polar amino acid transport system substrate-binding protein
MFDATTRGQLADVGQLTAPDIRWSQARDGSMPQRILRVRGQPPLTLWRLVLLPLAAVAMALLSASAAGEASVTVVATKEAPPFSYKHEDGQWSGISIELWQRIADRLDLPPAEFREMGLEAMLEALQKGEAAVAIAAISVTPEREKRVDFSHPYFYSGLGVAVSATRRGGHLAAIADELLTVRTLAVLAGVVSVLVLIGLVFWLLERGRSAPFKVLDKREGIGLGLWWSTIILLGNKGVVPSSALARMLAAGLMIASLLMVSAFVGAIASWFTVSQLERDVRQPEDLRMLRVATVKDTTSETTLREMRIAYRAEPDLDGAIQRVLTDRADALVYDAPVLRYLVNKEYQDRLRVLALRFHPQDYAIALPQGSTLREPVNRALLRLRGEPWWDELQFRYLGR